MANDVVFHVTFLCAYLYVLLLDGTVVQGDLVSQHTPAMKEWGEEIAASSECQKGCPTE